MQRLFGILALLEFLLLSAYTIIYMAGKDLFLTLGSLFILSSLAYASTSAILARIVDRVSGGMRGSYGGSASIGMAGSSGF